MGSVTQLWNPCGNRTLHRYWVSFSDRIIIEGENPEHAGVLSLRPEGTHGLKARLQILGSECESPVAPGCDITLWINGLALFIGVKAVEETRVLVAFGVPRDATVAVTVALDEGGGFVEQAMSFLNMTTMLCDYTTPRSGTPLQTAF